MDIDISYVKCSIIFFIILAIVTHQYLKRKKFCNLIDQVGRGINPLPMLGNALEMNIGGSDYRVDLMLTSPRDWGYSLNRLWIGPFPAMLVFDADDAEIVLSSIKHIEKATEYRFLHSWLGTGLLTSGGQKWHSRRKLLTGAFHFKILEEYISVFNEQSDILVSKIDQHVNTEKAFDIFPYITRCTLDIICESAMGKTVNAQEYSESPYVKAVCTMTSIVMSRATKPWLRPNFLYRFSSLHRQEKKCLDILHGFTNSVIKERKNISNKNKSKGRLAFLDLLIQASDDGKVLSDQDIREEVDTFMFEGHDTTSAAICWSLWLLGLHPKIQDRVHSELDSIFGQTHRPVTIDDLSEMKFLECCIKEALRLYPSVPVIARELREDLVIGGNLIPSGVTLLIMIVAIQRNPKFFSEPDSFKPDRFLSGEARNPFAFVPFSAGPRNCIGQRFAMMEEKVVISSILRRFRIESSNNVDRITFHAELILRSKNGIKVKLYKR
ncbi:cytochrome P450 4c3-like [Artemia franciscana]|uniref:cytochrome P450 4c3-like n=1 Tax=Artemia franciscana TaxID=6661 RepID=UPI0032DA32C8